MVTKYPQQINRCPECGQTGLEYDSNDADFSNCTMQCPWKCPHCKAEGVEHYALDFLNHSVTSAGDKLARLDQ